MLAFAVCLDSKQSLENSLKIMLLDHRGQYYTVNNFGADAV